MLSNLNVCMDFGTYINLKQLNIYKLGKDHHLVLDINQDSLAAT